MRIITFAHYDAHYLLMRISLYDKPLSTLITYLNLIVALEGLDYSDDKWL